MLRIVTILENRPSGNNALLAEFGLSFLVQVDKHNILFDCSRDAGASSNANRLNIDLNSIDYTIISHSHFDHAGGYPDFLQKGLRSPLITGVKFWEDKYSHQGETFTYLGCGFSQELLEKYKIEHRICKDMLELFPNCYVMSDFARTHAFEQIPQRFKKVTPQGGVPDDFADEVCLVIDTPKGLVVVVGCSHPGILNILDTIKGRLNKKIYALVGGSHLMAADEGRIAQTVKALEEYGIEIMGLNHCTGENAEHCISAQTTKMKIASMHSGDCLFL